jgi:hypothetical protein
MPDSERPRIFIKNCTFIGNGGAAIKSDAPMVVENCIFGFNGKMTVNGEPLADVKNVVIKMKTGQTAAADPEAFMRHFGKLYPELGWWQLRRRFSRWRLRRN